jgi:hypothetical protein
MFRLTKEVLARTAVWEGETIINWRWSAGSIDSGTETPLIMGQREEPDAYLLRGHEAR